MSTRRLAGFGLLGAAVLVAAVLSLAVGSLALAPSAVVAALLHPDGSEAAAVVEQVRLPRTALGLLAGTALGLAGALAQGHTRNPLADPGLLGVNAGAALAVVLGGVAGVGAGAGQVALALAGALAATAVVFGIGVSGIGGAGDRSPVTLALAGVAVSAVLGALTSAVVLADGASLDAYRFWAVGALTGSGVGAALVAPVIALGAVLALAGAPALNALALGDDAARALGHPVGRARVLGVLAVTLLAGGATAACGPIAFAGLVVPHAVRAFTGPDLRPLLPAAGLAGAALVLVADVLGRVVAPPGEVPVGIVLALVGGPVFVVLVRRRAVAA